MFRENIWTCRVHIKDLWGCADAMGMEVNGNRMRNGELYKLGFSRNFSLFFLPYILSTVHPFNDFVLRLSSSNTTHTPPHIRDFKEIFHFHLGRW